MLSTASDVRHYPPALPLFRVAKSNKNLLKTIAPPGKTAAKDVPDNYFRKYPALNAPCRLQVWFLILIVPYELIAIKPS